MAAAKKLALAILLLSAALVQAEETAATHLRTVERFIAAFNAHDSDAMASLVAEDVEWLSIAGDTVAVETRGRSGLVASMDAYFKSCPTCQSTLSGTLSTPDRVSAVEIATWQGKSGARSQRGLSVYEFSAGLIRRVYYFPAEK